MLGTLLILNIFLSIVSGKANSTSNKKILPKDTRVVGGYPCSINEHPYIVSVRHSISTKHFCAGSLLSKTWVLTAAHCCIENYKFGMIKVYAGVTSLLDVRRATKSYVIRQVIIKSYRKEFMINDIALLELKTPIYATTNIKYVTLPKPYAENEVDITSVCSNSTVLGWGEQLIKDEDGNPVSKYTKRDVRLQCANLPAITNEECTARMDYPVPSTIICGYLKGKDSCQGDSGGPLMCDNVQYGIVSSGIGCAYKHYPGLYTRVDMYTDFILTRGTGCDLNKLSVLLIAHILYSSSLSVIKYL